MTDKKLHFPSMDGMGEDDDSSDLYYQNDLDGDDGGGDERDDLLDGGTDDGETDGDHSGDSILAGERAVFDRIKELTAVEDGEEFTYFPAASSEENNRNFAIRELRKEWGANTSFNIGVARSFLKNFLDESLIREADKTGVGSHPLMILALYKAARQIEREAGSKSGEVKTLKFKSMNQIKFQKLEERAKELARRTYFDAKNAIIAKLGPLRYG